MLVKIRRFLMSTRSGCVVLVIFGFVLFMSVGKRSTNSAERRGLDSMPRADIEVGGSDMQKEASQNKIDGADLTHDHKKIGLMTNEDKKAAYIDDTWREHMPQIGDANPDTGIVHNGNVHIQQPAAITRDRSEKGFSEKNPEKESETSALRDNIQSQSSPVNASQNNDEDYANADGERENYDGENVGDTNGEGRREEERDGVNQSESETGESNWDDDGTQESKTAPKPNTGDANYQKQPDVEPSTRREPIKTPIIEKGVGLPQIADNQEGIMDDDFGEAELHLNEKDDDSAKKGLPVMVIIMAQWRFGSSIIGEIFNQNPRMFYLYEPLWVVEQMVHMWRIPGPFTREAYYYSTKLLQDISQCKFSDKFMDIVNITNHWGGRERSNAICRASVKDSCLIPNAEWLREVCLKYEGRLATKIIRGDLGIIKPLVDNNDVNVKVIHLVRDPRGSMASRINYLHQIENNELADAKYAKSGRLKLLNLVSFEHSQHQSVEGMCQWLRENVKARNLIPEWLKDRYYLLRYEDFADDPMRVMSELYEFTGQTLPRVVEDWVARNTQASRNAQGTFDVQKNSSTTARRWMTELSETEIRQVETQCMDVMKLLGYLPFQELRRQHLMSPH